MKVKLAIFPNPPIITGRNETELELSGDCTGRRLNNILPGTHAELKYYMDMAILSIDYTLTKDNTLIKPGMDISIFPPVMGG